MEKRKSLAHTTNQFLTCPACSLLTIPTLPQQILKDRCIIIMGKERQIFRYLRHVINPLCTKPIRDHLKNGHNFHQLQSIVSYCFCTTNMRCHIRRVKIRINTFVYTVIFLDADTTMSGPIQTDSVTLT